MRRLIVPLLLLALLLGALGTYLATRFEGPPQDTTASLVPSEVTLYASFFVDPSTSQKALLRDRVEEAGEAADVGSLVEHVLDRVTRSYGLPYEDVAPWIDRQMALFVLPRTDAGAVVVAVGDEGAARDAMERVDGVMLGDHAVFGDRRAVRAAEQVAKGKAASLDGPDSMNFADMTSDIPADRLAFAFAAGDLSSRAADLPPPLDAVEFPLGVAQGNAIALRATEAGLAFDGYSYSDGAALLLNGRDVPLKDLGRAGSDAWLAGIVPNLSVTIDALDREVRQVGRVTAGPLPRFGLPEVLEPTDQALFWVGGDDLSALSAGIDVTTGGGDASGRLARALTGVPGLQPRFTFRRNGLVATFGSEPRATLGSDPRYRQAAAWLGGLHPIGYIDLDKAGAAPSTLALLLGTRLGLSAGLALPSWFEDVDRVVVGLGEEIVPTHWRVLVSLGG